MRENIPLRDPPDNWDEPKLDRSFLTAANLVPEKVGSERREAILHRQAANEALMDEWYRRPIHRDSLISIQRAVFRLGIVAVFSLLSRDFWMALWLFSTITAGICVLQALVHRDSLFSTSLNRWDEALMIGLLGGIGGMIDGSPPA